MSSLEIQDSVYPTKLIKPVAAMNGYNCKKYFVSLVFRTRALKSTFCQYCETRIYGTYVICLHLETNILLTRSIAGQLVLNTWFWFMCLL